LGDDWHFWLIPTHPVLRTNYFERTWSRRDLRNKDVLKEEDDSDPDRKMLSAEQRRASFEKKLICVALVIVVTSWFLVGKDLAINHFH